LLLVTSSTPAPDKQRNSKLYYYSIANITTTAYLGSVKNSKTNNTHM